MFNNLYHSGYLLQGQQLTLSEKISRYEVAKTDNEKARLAWEIGEESWFRRDLPAFRQWLKTFLSYRATDTIAVNALNILANIHLTKADFDSAVYYNNESISLGSKLAFNPYEGYLYETRGRIFKQLGNYSKSIESFIRADKYYSQSGRAEIRHLSTYVLIELAKIYEEKNLRNDALQFYRQALNKSGRDGSGRRTATLALARFYTNSGTYEKAAPTTKHCLKTCPPIQTSAPCIFIRGMVTCWQRGMI